MTQNNKPSYFKFVFNEWSTWALLVVVGLILWLGTKDNEGMAVATGTKMFTVILCVIIFFVLIIGNYFYWRKTWPKK